MAKKTSSSRSKTTRKAPAKAAGRSKAGSPKKTTKKVIKTKASTKPAASKSSAKKKVASGKVASKKKVATKTVKKKTVKTKAPARKTTSKSKAASKKSVSKKPATKPTTRKKVAKKTPGKKVTPKKTVSKKTTKKTVSKKATTKKPAPKKTTSRKAPAKKVTSKKPVSKKAPTKKVGSKKVEKKVATTPAKGSVKTPAGGKDAGKGGRKGITVVPDKSRQRPRRSRPKPKITQRPAGSQLLAPGAPKRAPLIPSGPSAPKMTAVSDLADKGKIKCPFKKRELDKFRQLLLRKRRSLVGDVSQLENEALKSNAGNLSHTPSHHAEQGSDSADQTLSLGLAAADRRLINEIDDALKRIDDGKFGICEMTGETIRAERLEELPWARYTIAAARERERNMFRGNW